MDFDIDFIEMDCACKGRNLDKMLQPAILMILYKENLHGFLLIQKLGETPMFQGEEPDRSGVYRYLKKMESSGLLASQWEMNEDGAKPRRIFSITEKGKHCLVNWMVVLRQYAKSVTELASQIERVLR